jgi:predicted lipid-binding transport protein (Tim44 family)
MTGSVRRQRWIAAIAVALMSVLMTADVADARAGRGGGFGLRGSRSYQAPPATRTAPREAAPLANQQQAGPALGQQAQPRATAPGLSRPSPFGSRGFFGGLLGAGLLGMFLGYGFFGGLGGLASMVGMLLQLALVALVIMFVVRLFRQRAAVPAGAGHGSFGTTVPPLRRQATGHGGSAARRPVAGSDEVGISQQDLDRFEQALAELQAAYDRDDRDRLRELTWPEVATELERELDQNAARNVVNRVGDVKLLQGDLAEAWREGSSDYASVAMRYSLRDYEQDSRTGQIVSGDPDRLTEATEVWTFRRDRGQPWRVSAIQAA